MKTYIQSFRGIWDTKWRNITSSTYWPWSVYYGSGRLQSI